ESQKINEDEKAVEFDLSVERKQDEKLLSNYQNKNDENEKNREDKHNQKNSMPADNISNEPVEDIPFDTKNASINKSKVPYSSNLVDGDLFSNNTETTN